MPQEHIHTSDSTECIICGLSFLYRYFDKIKSKEFENWIKKQPWWKKYEKEVGYMANGTEYTDSLIEASTIPAILAEHSRRIASALADMKYHKAVVLTPQEVGFDCGIDAAIEQIKKM